ncbi:ABC transporter permease [Vagococcus sp. PNs007]|uniref:Transport permease protein n=1 Tax=Vagococcus proximus TaxID=2991417 RepID=A0ABT5X0M1_9ENTE|nr:ABC transporter permease [Vagococcus proximus]MDF0479552.1 ABC transporter permease [Vagococcus proximus]
MKAEDLRFESKLGVKGFRIVAHNEIVAFFLNKGLVLSQIIQPLLYVLFIGVGLNGAISSVFYNETEVSYLLYSSIGIFGSLIIGQTTQVIYRTTIDKRYGLLALKLSSGVSSIFYILGMSLYPMLGLLIQELIIAFILIFFNTSGISLVSLIFTIIFSIFILLFWTSVAILLTTYINDYQKRDIIIRFFLTPLGFTAPVFYMLKDVPTVLKFFAYLNPLTYQIDALRSIAFGINDTLLIFINIIMIIFAVLISAINLSKVKLVFKEI